MKDYYFICFLINYIVIKIVILDLLKSDVEKKKIISERVCEERNIFLLKKIFVLLMKCVIK